MATTTQNVPDQTLEDTLNKTDLGHYIYEYRKAVFALLLGLLVGAVSVIFWKQNKASQAENLSAEIYKFNKNEFTQYKEGKLEADKFVTQLKNLSPAVKASPDIVPFMFEASKTLVEKDQATLALDALKNIIAEHSNQKLSYFFLAQQYAALAESAGQVDEAIQALENLTKSPFKINKTDSYLFESKINLDLGRLYIAKGDKEKAKKTFNDLIAKYPNDELAKIAKLYLQEL